MKKIFLAMTALGAIAAAAPAAAQPNRYPAQAYVDGSIEARLAQLDARLEAGLRAGTIDRRELRQLRMELREIRRLEAHYARGGLNRAERQDLRTRLQTLRQRIAQAEDRSGRDGRWQDRDDDDRWDRDRNRRDGRDCPPGLERRGNGCVPPGQVGRDRDWDRDDDDRGGFIDRNRDGYDDRDTNRDGRIDGRDRDYDDRYEDRDRRGTVGRVFDQVFGGGELRVGQRVSGNLAAVPSEYRNRFRDGNGVYYRSDGRSIYRIDARTQVVLQIYAMNR